ncbi:peptidylprolyl isomerase [Paenalkalicoccus suaedae]|uniref:Peptidyl-prolyl cis-trans isomerase n=1 Tax=Paenalkalicoccus suaedae TaxID=2592382 RepID=A0A859FEM5_9BACI|nr:peptidylprolyl isomerase [Paenalkalicoccus suaedae]QKS71320.1 peptidylprolyl isomerase [Paenalkalicoccus suaedae]
MKKTAIALSTLFVLAACGNDAANEGTIEMDNTNNTNATEETNEATNSSNNASEEGNNEPTDDAMEEEIDLENLTYPQLEDTVAENEEEAIITTNYGEIRIKLFPDVAPLAVENFLTHAEEGYYDGLIFHRVIENFMIQGGDPTGSGMGGESVFGESFEDEFDPSLAHFKGALSMANSGPNTNGSQFFIVQAGPDAVSAEMFEGSGFPQSTVDIYLEQGGTPHLDFGHTVFGHVIEGMDVVDDIAAVETGAADLPEEEVIIETIEVVE